MKSRVILYGVRGMRKKIEHLLDDNYEIVGYSDADLIYAEINEYEYKSFYSPEKLDESLFDYIILTIINQDISKEAVQKLIEYGIPKNKIIETARVMYLKSPFTIPLDRYEAVNSKFKSEGLFFGMSYTYYGLLTYCFSKRFYKLAHFSADIFFHFKNLEYLSKKTDCLEKEIKYIVFEMPYYAFNWDVSKTENIIRSRMALYERFDDYHNYGKTEDERSYIKEYRILKDMFGKKSAYNSSSFSNNFEHREASGLNEREHPFYKTEHIWTKIRPETIAENNELFRKTLEIIFSMNEKIKVLVVVAPFYLDFLQDQMHEIERMKEIFYTNIDDIKKDYPIELMDCIDALDDKRLFADIHHLNAEGAYEFSKILNARFEKEFY